MTLICGEIARIFPARLQAGVVGQPHVQKDDIGHQALTLFDPFRSRGGLTDHLDAGPALEEHAQARAHHFVIIDDEQTQYFAS